VSLGNWIFQGIRPMRTKIVITILISVVMIFVSSQFIAALDAPHNSSNIMNCGDCHGQTLLNSPFWTNSEDYDIICTRCHTAESGPYSQTNAPIAWLPLVTPHANKQCRDCHDPHYQWQKMYKNTNASDLFLATGKITSYEFTCPVCPKEFGTTTLTYSSSSITYKPGWDAEKLIDKTGSGEINENDKRSAVLFPKLGKIGYDLPIIAVDTPTSNTITVKGNAAAFLCPSQDYKCDPLCCDSCCDESCTKYPNCDPCPPPKTYSCTPPSPTDFAAMYGQYIKDVIDISEDRSGINKTVKLLDQTGTNSFADGDTTYYDGMCEVCHTQTNHFRNAPGASDQNHTNLGSGIPGIKCTGCHTHLGGFKESDRCIDCHSISFNGRAAITPQFNSNSHHVQGASLMDEHCYQCHWEANSDGSINATYHEGYDPGNPWQTCCTSGAKVDLVIYGNDGLRPSEPDSGTVIEYVADGSRAEIKKLNTHCLSCHSEQNNSIKPFGDGIPPNYYAWDGTSIDERYSQTETTTWGKYSGGRTTPKNTQTKAYSAHGNAINNQGGWDLNETWTNTRNGTEGTENIACFDCHNSHGSTVSGITTSYTSATTNGGILKDTIVGRGGYSVTYKPQAGGSVENKNPYNAGAGLCFDCHMNSTAVTTPWGYESTFGAEKQIMGYWDTPYFGPGISGIGNKSGTIVTDTNNNFNLYLPSLAGYLVVISDDDGNKVAKGSVTSNTATSFTVDSWTALYGGVPDDVEVGYYFAVTGPQQRFPYKSLMSNKGGHFWASSTLLSPPDTDKAINGLCTPCHDPHGVSTTDVGTCSNPSYVTKSTCQSGGGTWTVAQQYGVPLLKGTWLTSPYKEDVAPADNASRTIHDRVPPAAWNDKNEEGCAEGHWYLQWHEELGHDVSQYECYKFVENYDKLGYHIDQNTFGPNIRDSVVGVTQTDTQFAGLCLKCHPKDSLTDGETHDWKSKDRIHESVKEWKTVTGPVKHNYTCSKCHTPHNSGLPRLMVTNCLNPTHKGRVFYNSSPVISDSGQDSHGDNGSGQGGGRIPGSYSWTGLGDGGTDTSGDFKVTCHEGETGRETDQRWNVKTQWAQCTPTISDGPTAGSFTATDSNVQATITWQTASCSSSSYVDYGLTSSYGLSTGNDNMDYNHSILLQNLTNHSTYHYRVRSASMSDEVVSGDNTFYISISPTVPTLTDVPGTLCSSSCPITLEYSSTDPDDGTVEYFVEIDTNNPPVSTSTNYQSSNWTTLSSWEPTLSIAPAWYWRARARDKDHTEAVSNWSSTDFFWLATSAPPPAPTVVNPGGYGYCSNCYDPVSVTLQWTEVTDPDEDPVEYYVEVNGYGSSGWITEEVANCDGSTCSWDISAEPGSSYSWHVKARDATNTDAESLWSDPDYFEDCWDDC
jgi:hypothetical protein